MTEFDQLSGPGWSARRDPHHLRIVSNEGGLEVREDKGKSEQKRRRKILTELYTALPSIVPSLLDDGRWADTFFLVLHPSKGSAAQSKGPVKREVL
jgi:hypothetical protein